jgi:hypothetical protein
MWNTRYFIVPFETKSWRDPNRSSISFELGTRAVCPKFDRSATENDVIEMNAWADRRDFRVLRNLNEYPRAWVVHNVREATRTKGPRRPEQDDELREILYAADPIWNEATQEPENPRETAWVERDDLRALRAALSGRAPKPSERVTVDYPDPQRAVLEVELDSPGLVVLADVYYPGWKLQIDGEPAPIYRVNGSMRGALVMSGHHRLEFQYDPLSFRVGCVLSSCGVVALLLSAVACARRPIEAVVAGHSVLGGSPPIRESPADFDLA